jgi:hypothetical protein
VPTLKDMFRKIWVDGPRQAPPAPLRADPPVVPRPRPSTVPAEYRPLHKYLEERFAENLVLTFGEIEDLLGFPLPESARVEAGWWVTAEAGGARTPQSRAWTEASRTAKANVPAQIVLFQRASP